MSQRRPNPRLLYNIILCPLSNAVLFANVCLTDKYLRKSLKTSFFLSQLNAIIILIYTIAIMYRKPCYIFSEIRLLYEAVALKLYIYISCIIILFLAIRQLLHNRMIKKYIVHVWYFYWLEWKWREYEYTIPLIGEVFFIAEPKKLCISYTYRRLLFKKKCNQFLDKIKYGFDRNVYQTNNKLKTE